jgi:hypothetical protein
MIAFARRNPTTTPEMLRKARRTSFHNTWTSPRGGHTNSKLPFHEDYGILANLGCIIACLRFDLEPMEVCFCHHLQHHLLE